MGDENLRKRKKKTGADEPDVVGHVADDPGEDDPERKRKRKRKVSDEREGEEFERKRK